MSDPKKINETSTSLSMSFFCFILIASYIFAFFLFYYSPPESHGEFIVIAIILASFGALIGIFALTTFFHKIVWNEDTITHRDMFGRTKKIKFSELKSLSYSNSKGYFFWDNKGNKFSIDPFKYGFEEFLIFLDKKADINENKGPKKRITWWQIL